MMGYYLSLYLFRVEFVFRFEFFVYRKGLKPEASAPIPVIKTHGQGLSLLNIKTCTDFFKFFNLI
jgi:hypothetical protein